MGVRSGQVGSVALDQDLQPAFTIAGGKADSGDPDARFPYFQRKGSRGKDKGAGHSVQWLINQIKQHRSIIASHHAGAKRGRQDIYDRLRKMRIAGKGCARMAVDTNHRLNP